MRMRWCTPPCATAKERLAEPHPPMASSAQAGFCSSQSRPPGLDDSGATVIKLTNTFLLAPPHPGTLATSHHYSDHCSAGTSPVAFFLSCATLLPCIAADAATAAAASSGISRSPSPSVPPPRSDLVPLWLFHPFFFNQVLFFVPCPPGAALVRSLRTV